MSGTGMKCEDVFTMPLCLSCHLNIHNAREGWRVSQRTALLETLIKAVREGMLVRG